MTVALKVCLSQLQTCQCCGLKPRQKIQRSPLCEVRFSAVMATNTKLRSRLDSRNTLWVSLSPITPWWDHPIAEKQAHGPH